MSLDEPIGESEHHHIFFSNFVDFGQINQSVFAHIGFTIQSIDIVAQNEFFPVIESLVCGFVAFLQLPELSIFNLKVLVIMLVVEKFVVGFIGSHVAIIESIVPDDFLPVLNDENEGNLFLLVIHSSLLHLTLESARPHGCVDASIKSVGTQVQSG